MRQDLLQFVLQLANIQSKLLQNKRDSDASKMVTEIFSEKYVQTRQYNKFRDHRTISERANASQS